MWIGIAAVVVVWVFVAIAVAVLIGRVVSHADLEEKAEVLRREDRSRGLPTFSA
ncbi:hypothetical protein DFR67_102323 [Williamsia limnetica]|uniref:Uncharacterized protein n=1 Tax=Williamsia limnetica TaxID=882452 RepID=A0A318RNH9_WILLI|nr:hypothetical protein [Williamsia limnetica]PYE20185.1 hypothetical protein DFR67_102323 [Williamsia limnetica]